MLVQILHAGMTDAVLPEQALASATTENGWATTTTILQLTATLDDVLNQGKEGQAWILPWDMASIHASRDHQGRHPAAQHVVLAAMRRGQQVQELHPGASARHSCSLRPRRLVRRLGLKQGMAAPVFGRKGGSRTHGPRRHKPGVDVWVASLARPYRRRLPRGR